MKIEVVAYGSAGEELFREPLSDIGCCQIHIDRVFTISRIYTVGGKDPVLMVPLDLAWLVNRTFIPGEVLNLHVNIKHFVSYLPLAPAKSQQLACTKCGIQNEYATPNKPDGSYVCYECR